jgi:DNA-binding IclR family transcriptional regulator
MTCLSCQGFFSLSEATPAAVARLQWYETVNLGRRDGCVEVFVEMVKSQRFLRMQAELGNRDPVNSTALGKAHLAFIPEEQWSKHLN